MFIQSIEVNNNICLFVYFVWYFKSILRRDCIENTFKNADKIDKQTKVLFSPTSGRLLKC